MAGKLRKIADQYATIFWILCVLFYIIGYKLVSVNILGKTSYSYDVAFLKLSLSFLAIIMMKEMYKGEFSFHLRTEKMMKGLLLLWPGLLFLVFNILKTNIQADKIVTETLLMVVITNMITGFYEEIIMRGMLLGHMMKHWKNDEKKVLKSVVVTSILFGAVHLGNLVYGNILDTIFQVFYATTLGLVFGASYLRTKNLWACIFIHGIIDVSSAVYTINYAPGEEVVDMGSGNGLMGSGIGFLLVLAANLLSVVVFLYELRKEKRAEIVELWADELC